MRPSSTNAGRRSGLLAAALLAAAFTVPSAGTAHAAKVERVVSPGGIEAWLMHNPATPVIHVRFSFDGGTAQDPVDRPGVAYATAYMFDEGAGTMDAQAFTAARNKTATGLGGSASGLFFSGAFSTHSKYRDEAFHLLKLALLEPRFDAEPLARMRLAMLTMLKRAEGDPASIVAKALRERVFPGHRFSVAAVGTPESVQAITVEDMKAYRRRILARDGLKIAVVGDIDAKTLATVLDDVFGSLPAKGERRPVPAPQVTAGGQQVIDMELPQAMVQFQRLTRRLGEREEIAASILDTILSDSMVGRLFVEVREKRGLVYGIGSAYSDYRIAGSYWGSFGSANATALTALDVAMGVLGDIAKNGPTEEEVVTAKRTLVGRRLFAMESSASLAGTILNMQVDRLPITYLDDLSGIIESITREEVAKVARELLDTSKFNIIVAGRPAPAKRDPG